MEKLRQWFSRTPSPPGTPPRRSHTPPPASDNPAPIHWSPHLNLRGGASWPPPAPDLSLRKRLVRLPDGDDVLLAEAPVASASSTSPPPRRRLVDAFDAMEIQGDRKHTLAHQTAPQPPLQPLPQALAGFLDGLKKHRLPLASDLAAIGKALLDQEELLTLAEVDAFAHALAAAVIGSSQPASRGMAQIVQHLLLPLDTRLGPCALGALTHGLMRGCRQLAANMQPAHTARGLGVAQDLLSRHVAHSAQRLGALRHAIQLCALARAGGRDLVAGPAPASQSLGWRLAHDPLEALRSDSLLLDDADRLRLFGAALRMPPGITSRAQADRLRDRILGSIAAGLQPTALTFLLACAGHQLPPGSWTRERLGGANVRAMTNQEMLGAVTQCIKAFQRAVDAAQHSQDAGLQALRAGRAVVADTTRGRELVFDEESVQRVADELLQQRHEQALQAAVARVLRFHACFEHGAQPAWLRAHAEWLRQQVAGGMAPENAVVSLAVAAALERRAAGLVA